MTSVAAAYYDGHTAKRHAVTLTLSGDTLAVIGDGVDRAAPLHELRLSEPMGAAPRLVTFVDGAYCEIRDFAGFSHLLDASGYRDHFVVRWQTSLRWMLAAVAALIILGATTYRYGVPWLAERMANHIPEKFVISISDNALEQIDHGLAQPSELPAARRDAISVGFDRLVTPAGEHVPRHIVFRRSPLMGANALALPSGTIIVFDDLVTLADKDEQIFGVLSHELGHVQGRHSLRLMLESSIIGLLTTWYVGDVSSLLATAPALLLQISYSRALEREADAYAVAMLNANGISPSTLADMLEKLEQSHAAKKHEASPMPDYLSTHPATEERLRFLRSETRPPTADD
jgi:Zn-dependent protease with chaperone function